MLADTQLDFELVGLRQEGHPLGAPSVPAISLGIVGVAKDLFGLENTSRKLKEVLSGRSMEEAACAGASTSDSPTSRFTAVNGEKQPGGATTETGISPSRRSSDAARSNGQPRITPPGQEKLTITTTSNMEVRQPYQQFPEGAPSLKRRRSGSVDPIPQSAHPGQGHGMPFSAKETAMSASIESDAPRDEQHRSQSDHRDAYSAAESYRSYMTPADETPSVSHDMWHSRQFPPPHQTGTDEHMGEALQRASHGIDVHRQQQYEHGSPNDERAVIPYGYSPDHREMSAGGDPKKRKRNFSNRTKTGCMTCRKRKKKCDETHPECSNCLRGGFICSGYQQRNHQWTKQEQQKQSPVPLQSKTDYENSGYPPSSYKAASLNQPPPARRDLPGYRGQSLQVDPQYGRPLNKDDDQPSASTMPSATTMSSATGTSPDSSRLSATVSYAHQMPTPLTATNSAYPDRQPKSAVYERIGPLHDPTRTSQDYVDTGTPQSAASALPQILHPALHTPIESPHSAHPQKTAQLALSNLASSSSPSQGGRQRSQKEEMLLGRFYYPYDKELVLEREKCNGACWRFNSSANPNNGVSPEERSRLFRDILQPALPVSSPATITTPSPTGRIDDNVIVEAPFTCDYGYNISLGADVHISKNCTIVDTVSVVIGDRCVIGPSVNIYTGTLHIDPKKRMGNRGSQKGEAVVIQEDVWISGNVTILPGCKIGRGSTVGAGSVVTKDVPEYTIVGGNPAQVLRGIRPG